MVIPCGITPTSKVIGIDPWAARCWKAMIYDPLTTTESTGCRVFRDPFPNNIIPRDRFDRCAVKIQALFPGTTGPLP